MKWRGEGGHARGSRGREREGAWAGAPSGQGRESERGEDCPSDEGQEEGRAESVWEQEEGEGQERPVGGVWKGRIGSVQR